MALLLAPAGSVAAQASPRVEARVSADSVKIGERFAVTLVAEHATSAEVLFPSRKAGAVVFGDLQVIRRGRVQGGETTDGRQVDSVAYEVATFALDSAGVPVLPVRIVAESDTTIVGTAPRVVSVTSVVGPDADGLRTPAMLAAFHRPLWVWGVLGLAAAVLLGGLTYAWWRRDDGVESSASEEETKTPYEAASARLEYLERRNPNDRQSCKAFYIDLTETVRVYLAKRVGVTALECTTSEMVAALRQRSDVPEAATQRLERVLAQADLVKFADAQPPPDTTRVVLQNTKRVLDTIEGAQRRAEAQTQEGTAPATA